MRISKLVQVNAACKIEKRCAVLLGLHDALITLYANDNIATMASADAYTENKTKLEYKQDEAEEENSNLSLPKQ